MTGDTLEQLLIEAIENKVRPVRNSSMSKDCLLSSAEGINDIAPTVGVETHEGGPNEFEYPVRTCIGFPSTSCLVVQFRKMGESCLLDSVSGTTCFLPGMCLT